jgi:hypothetical protein
MKKMMQEVNKFPPDVKKVLDMLVTDTDFVYLITGILEDVSIEHGLALRIHNGNNHVGLFVKTKDYTRARKAIEGLVLTRIDLPDLMRAHKLMYNKN